MSWGGTGVMLAPLVSSRLLAATGRPADALKLSLLFHTLWMLVVSFGIKETLEKPRKFSASSLVIPNPFSWCQVRA
jgi:hypothetical protein